METPTLTSPIPSKSSGSPWLFGLPVALLLMLFGGCPKGDPGIPEGDFNLGARPPVISAKSDAKESYRVLHITPGSGQEASPDSSVFVYFNEPVVSLTEGEARPSDLISLLPAVPGKLTWRGASLAEFKPAKPLTLSTEYQVKIKPHKSKYGKPLSGGNVFKFQTAKVFVDNFWGTPSIAAEEDDSDPVVEPEGDFYMAFSQPVNPGALVPLLKIGGKPVVKVEEIGVKDLPSRAYLPAGDYKGKLFRLKPSQGVVIQDNKITLELAQGQIAVAGPLPMAYGWSGTKYVANPFQLTFGLPNAENCEQQLSLYFNRRVKEKDLRAHVSIEPPAPFSREIQTEGSRSDFYNLFRLKPGVSYRLAVKPGIAAVTGEVLQEDISQSFTVPGNWPVLQFRKDTMILEGNSPNSVALFQENLQNIRVSMAKLSTMDLVKEIGNDSGKTNLKAGSFLSLDPAGANVFSKVPVSLSSLGKNPGAVALVAESSNSKHGCIYSPDDANLKASAVVQTTNLALTVKDFERGVLAWVTTLDKGAVQKGAAVEVYSVKGKKLGSGKTAVDGMALIPIKRGKDDEKLIVVASLGKDRVASSTYWDEGIRGYEFGLDDWRRPEGEIEGSFILERNLYRPGETFRFSFLGRERTGNQLKPPAGNKIEFRLYGPKDNLERTWKLKLDEFGMASAQYEVAQTMEGYLRLEALVDGDWIAGESVRTTSFRPIAFETKLDSPADINWGKEVVNKVSVNYLAGPPVGFAKVELALSKQPGSFEDPQGEGYFFDTRSWWDLEDQSSETEEVERITRTVDEDGKLHYSFVAKRDKANYFPVTYVLEATGQDESYQRVSARARMTAYPSDAMVGLKLQDWFAETGQAIKPLVKVVSPSGQKLKDLNPKITLEKITWQTVKLVDEWGDVALEQEEKAEVVATCTVVKDCKLVAKEAGEYRIRAALKTENGEHRSQLWVYVFGKGEVSPWENPDHNRVDLTPDRKEYHPGQVAELLFKNPYPKAKALLTVETNKVISRKVIELKGSMVRLKVPVTEEMVPGAFVSVFAVQGRSGEKISKTGQDVGKPGFRIGMAELRVNPEGRRLAFSVKAPESVRPGSDITVDLSAKHSSGAPCDCQMAVMVVDEAVLKLTGFQTMDPMNLFFSPQPLGVRSSTSLLHVVGRELYQKKGHNPGGDGKGAGLGNLRSDFRLTAFFDGAVKTGKDGKAQIKFKLPESLTSYRVMVVGVSRKDHFGSTQSTVKTSLPLLVRAALPKFVRRGDVVDVAFTVQQIKSASARANLKWAMEGGEWLEAPPNSVDLSKNSARRVSGWLKPGNGVLKLSLVAEMDGERDGMTMTIPIRPGMEPKVITRRITFKRSGDLVATPTGFVMPEQSSLNLSLSFPVEASLLKAGDELLPYPYDCLEQRTSKLIAYIGLRGFEIATGETILKPSMVTAFQRKLNSLDDYKASSGDLWALWPGSREGQVYHTARALVMLKEAQDLKIYKGKRPETQLKALLEWLNKTRGRFLAGPDLKARLDQDLMALEALKVWGMPHQAGEEFYLSLLNSPGLSLVLGPQEQLAILRLAADGGSRSPNVRRLMAKIKADFGGKQLGLRKVSWQGDWTYSCELCAQADYLKTLMLTRESKTLIDEAALILAERFQRNSWATTFQSATVLQALGRYAVDLDKDIPEIKSSVSVAGTAKGDLKPVNHSKRMLGSFFGLKDLPQDPWKLKVNTNIDRPMTATARYVIERQFHLSPAEENGLVLWVNWKNEKSSKEFKAGEPLDIEVLMASPRGERQVVLEIPLPSGVEPVDTSLATSASSRDEEEDGEVFDPWCDCYRKRDSSGGFNNRLPKGALDHLGFYDDKLVAVVRYLPPGMSTLRLPALAQTAGRFQVSEAHLSAMYAPEIYARSGSELLVIQR